MATQTTASPESDGPKTSEAAEVLETREMDDYHPGPRLWIITVGLGITLLLTALENTVVTVAMPVIISNLGLGQNSIWITNAFFIACAAGQPLIGQLCNIFGRKWIVLSCVAIFVLGSGLCGGANSKSMLIAGRAVQGLGSGGITLLNDIIISDLVPLRLRGIYIGVILCIYGVGVALGPFIGGAIVAVTTWRWIFYINLPVGGVSFTMLLIFLQVNHGKRTTFVRGLRRIDFLGNAVLISAAVSILYTLAYAGDAYSWASWHILVPLIVGLMGLVLFGYTQSSSRIAPPEPVMPPRLFNDRTSIIISVNTFINSALTFWAVFFLTNQPVFFQAVKLYGPRYSGVALLPMALVAIPGSAIAAVAISLWGRYKPVHFAGFLVFTLGFGLFALQNPTTSVAQWASYQCVCALGGGVLLNAQLPAFQNISSEEDQAAASAAWNFIRSIGWVWGVAIPQPIFNNRVNQLLGGISDPTAVQMLSTGAAYGTASAAQVSAFPPSVQQEIRSVYSQALQRVF